MIRILQNQKRKKNRIMAIILTLHPSMTASDLIHNINEKIDNNEIRVWEYDDEGDYTHTSTQWNKKSWFRYILPQEGDTWHLKFAIIGHNQNPMTRDLYGIYHGRFAEMLLTYYDRVIESFTITPQRDPADCF